MTTPTESVVCGICFCEIDEHDNPRGLLNCCNHLYCFVCISTWAKDTNVCPQCKARFNRITEVVPSGTEGKVIKARKKNYRGWEDDSSDDEGSSELLLPTCRVCGSCDNAARLLLCDRRACDYCAHSDCLGIDPEVMSGPFYCEPCRALRVADSPASTPTHADDERLARDLESAMKRRPPAQTIAVKTPSARPPPPPAPTTYPAVVPPPPPRAPVVAQPRPFVVQPEADDDPNVPYYLKQSAHAALHFEQLQSRLTATKYLRDSAYQRRQQLQSAQSPASVVSLPKRPRQDDAVPQSGTQALEEQKEPTLEELVKVYFTQQYSVVQRQVYIEENQLRLDGAGNIIAAAPATREYELARQEKIRLRTLRVAQKLAEEQLARSAGAKRDAQQRLLARKAEREAIALGRLALLIAKKRREERAQHQHQ